MAEKDTKFSGKIRHKGMFNFKDLYAFLYDILTKDGYKVTEKKYSEEISGDMKVVKIDWDAKKNISDYFQFIITISWVIVALKSVEIQKDGKKIKTNSGDMEISIKGIIVKDYENRWEDQPFWKFLRGVYERYIIKSRIEEYEDDIKDGTEDFIENLKAFLILEGKRP